MKFKLDINSLLGSPIFPDSDYILESIKEVNSTFEVDRDYLGRMIVICENKPKNKLFSGIVWKQIELELTKGIEIC